MTDREMVTALRAGDRLAAGQIYDIYGTRLYAYCHELLGDHKLAGDALRDTFIVAANRVRELRVPDALGAWLYAVARKECDRVGISEEIPEDAGAAVRGDRLARLALDCYAMQSPEVREILDLAFRHRLIDSDLALVLGTSEPEVVDMIGRAQADMENTLLMVLAARTGDPKCAEATEFGRRFEDLDGKSFTSWLGTIGKHAERCSICGSTIKSRHPLRLFEELPHSYLPPGVRSRVLETLRDPAGVAFAARIAERAGKFDDDGFPMAGRGGNRNGNRWILPLVAFAAVAVCGVVSFILFGGHSPAAAATPTSTSTSAGTPTSTFSSLTLPSDDSSDTASDGPTTTAPPPSTSPPAQNPPVSHTTKPQPPPPPPSSTSSSPSPSDSSSSASPSPSPSGSSSSAGPGQ